MSYIDKIMDKDISFSIVIPTYNRAKLIGKTIQSAIDQKYQNFEIIIIDDESTDNTKEIVEAFNHPKIKYFWKQNGERGAARNYGMLISKGDYVTFLDSDDLLFPDYLANAAESLKKYQYPMFFHLGYAVTDINLKPQAKINFLKNDDKKCLIAGNPLSCLGVFMHKSIVVYNLFNEDRDLAGSEDWELWLRVIANYGIKTDNRISAALINHDARSVLNYKEETLIARKTLALSSAFRDKKVQEVYGKHRNKLEAHFETYVALHLVLSNKNWAGLRHLLKAFFIHPTAILQRRTLAIFKHIFYNFVRILK